MAEHHPAAKPGHRLTTKPEQRLAPSADPDQPELAHVIAALRRAMRRAARAAGRDGELPRGLSVAQLELLSALADQPGGRPSQLARQLRLAPSSVTTLVNGLRQAELVTRTGGGDDRRTASLLLTADGEDAVVSWQDVNERILDAAMHALAPGTAAAVEASLPALAELTAAVDAQADDKLAALPPAAATRLAQD
jgi:DNA-binding MarR family transcriptional regulator